MMLEAGAETDVVNSVGRTAAQMAAFVGKLKVQYLFLNPYSKMSDFDAFYQRNIAQWPVLN